MLKNNFKICVSKKFKDTDSPSELAFMPAKLIACIQCY